MIFFVFEQAYSIATCVRQGDISALSFQCAKDVVFFFFSFNYETSHFLMRGKRSDPAHVSGILLGFLKYNFITKEWQSLWGQCSKQSHQRARRASAIFKGLVGF